MDSWNFNTCTIWGLTVTPNTCILTNLNIYNDGHFETWTGQQEIIFSTATGDPMSISSDVIRLEWCKYIHYEETGVGKHAVLLLPGALGSTTTDF